MEGLLRSLRGVLVSFQKLPPNFSEAALVRKSPEAMHSGATS